MKLSLSRGILVKGQVPMGMKVSRCLLGAAVRGTPACSAALSLCSLQGGRAKDTGVGWDGHPRQPSGDAWKDPLESCPGGERRLYLSAGSPYRSSPEKLTASRISHQKILFQALGMGRGIGSTRFTCVFICTQSSAHTYEKPFVQLNVSFYYCY